MEIKRSLVLVESKHCRAPFFELPETQTHGFSLVYSGEMGEVKAHYHLRSHEWYIVLNGWIEVATFDSITGEHRQAVLQTRESIHISSGIHHCVLRTGPATQFVCVTAPAWTAADEVASDMI
jgi:oxalate decarboxylase/phosphoglucose isomerase-like protein (cupin superfamily)